MKVKFSGDVEVKRMEWLYMAMMLTVMTLLVSGKTDEAMQFFKRVLAAGKEVRRKTVACKAGISFIKISIPKLCSISTLAMGASFRFIG